MTSQKHFKALIRARMARIGERYVAARKQLLDGLARVSLELVAEFKAHDRHCIAVRFTPDGRELISGGFQGQARVWSTKDWSQVGEFVGHTASVNGLAIEGRTDRMITASSDKSVRLWDRSTRREIAVVGQHSKQALSADISPDGAIAVTGGFDGKLRLWSLDEQSELPAIEVGERITGAAFHPSEPWIAATTIGARVGVWSIEGEAIASLESGAEATLGARWSSGGEFLLAAGSDGAITLWSSDGWEETRRLEVPAGSMLPVALSSDGSLLAAGWANHVGLWRADRYEPVAVVDGLPKGVYALDFSPDGELLAPHSRMLAQGGADGRVRVWRVN